jgi:hypothetical protein
MNCIELYRPHRVARQLGFDQDIPGMISCANSDWERAWDTYNIEAQSSEFIFRNHKPGVTVQYARWWKPYSSACGTAGANAAQMKEHCSFVSPVKRKTEGVPAANSGKRLRVDTANRGRPPHILTGASVYPSYSSASQAAIRRAAAAPGLVLRACPPHLRFRAMPATAVNMMAQTMPDASNDHLDHVPLSERLNSTTKMPKQHNIEGLAKGGDQEKNVGSVKSFIPRSETVGSNKEVLHTDVGQPLADVVASTANLVHESFGRSVTEKAQGKCLQQSREENLNILYEENNSRIEYCAVLLPNVVPGAVSSESNETPGSGAVVDMLPTLEDLLISDDNECDKLSGTESEVNAMPVKSNTLRGKTSPIRQGHEDTQLVDARNNAEDEHVLEKVTVQGNHFDIVEISDDDLDEEANKEDMMLGAKTSPIILGNEDTQLVDARNNAQDEHVLQKVTIQGNHFNIVEISDDDLDEEASKEDMMFDEAMSKEDGLDTMHMHLKSPKMETTWSILQERNEEKQMVSERNDEQDNLVMNEIMVQGSHDCEPGSVSNKITHGQEQDVLTRSVTLQTDGSLLKGPTEEMHTCIVTGDGNTDNAPMGKNDSLDHKEKGNEDILVSNQDLESPMEDSIGANRKRSGIRINQKADLHFKFSAMEIKYHNNLFLFAFSFAGDSERFSSRMFDENAELISSEVCTNTLYYLSRFDLVRDSRDKDANSTTTNQDVYLPRRAVGTKEMIKKASAIRQAEIAELEKDIHNLMEEILVLEANKGRP